MRNFGMLANFDYVIHWGEAKWSDTRNRYVYPGYGRGSVAIDADMKIHINHMAGTLIRRCMKLQASSWVTPMGMLQ